MTIGISKTFSTVEELIHEEEVLFNEASRMQASADILEQIKEQIKRHKAELITTGREKTTIADNAEFGQQN